jgi:hypothetical protein
MRNGQVFLKSGLKVKSQKKKKNNNIKIKLPIFFQKSFAKRKQNGYIFTIMLQMIRLWSIFINNQEVQSSRKIKLMDSKETETN